MALLPYMGWNRLKHIFPMVWWYFIQYRYKNCCQHMHLRICNTTIRIKYKPIPIFSNITVHTLNHVGQWTPYYFVLCELLLCILSYVFTLQILDENYFIHGHDNFLHKTLMNNKAILNENCNTKYMFCNGCLLKRAICMCITMFRCLCFDMHIRLLICTLCLQTIAITALHIFLGFFLVLCNYFLFAISGLNPDLSTIYSSSLIRFGVFLYFSAIQYVLWESRF